MTESCFLNNITNMVLSFFFNIRAHMRLIKLYEGMILRARDRSV